MPLPPSGNQPLLNAYGYRNKSLKVINDFRNDAKQRTKISSNFTSWSNIVYGIPHGSILRPILFHIYINDLFLFTNDLEFAN